METVDTLLPFQLQLDDSDPTYEAWKHRGRYEPPHSSLAFRSYLRGMETEPTDPQSLVEWEFRSYLRGMETFSISINKSLLKKFRSYLRGMETMVR